MSLRVILTGLAAASFLGMATIWTPIQAQEKKAAKAKAPAAPAVTQFPGRGQKLDAIALAKVIDAEVAKKLASEKIPASAKSTDAEFLRRVHLDLVGVIPTAEQVQKFLKDTNPNKRAKVIDELLSDARYGSAMAEFWSGLMIPRESNNRRLDHTPLQQWLTKSFNDNMPLDKFAYELLTATGDQDKNGAVTYFIGNPTVDKMTDNVTKIFMGIQLQCAQCHNHPFTDYKQDDYWGMAAFFMKTKLTTNVNAAAKKGVAPGIVETTSIIRGKGLPEAAKILPAKYLQSELAQVGDKDPSRPVLAKWMTSPENRYFAKAMANRFWHQVFGRGIVNPVDDMHDDNLASHPELLAALTEQLKANNFDLKYFLRAICNSETYQRTSEPFGDNKDDRIYYSHRIIRVLSPEQLYDSYQVALGGVRDKAPEAGRKQQGKGGNQGGREGFLNFFRIDEGNDPVEYQVGIPQALRLMNSREINATGVVDTLLKSGAKDGEIVEGMYLRVLSRQPSAQEREKMAAYVTKTGDPRTAYTDILWALLNSSEFALNH